MNRDNTSEQTFRRSLWIPEADFMSLLIRCLGEQRREEPFHVILICRRAKAAE